MTVTTTVSTAARGYRERHVACRQELSALLVLSFPLAAFGQTATAPSPLFEDDQPLRLTLEGPFRTLSRDRYERPELDGMLRYESDDGSIVTLDVQIRPRGNSRTDICAYPPLRLNLRRRQVEGTLFAGQNQLKLVTLCKNLAAYRDYLALEYELYRVFSLLSTVSYRVRWAEIDYVEAESRRSSSRTMPGFLIETDTAVAARNGMEVWSVERFDIATLDPESTALLSLFQFMIGNTDWSPITGPPGDRCCHNADSLRNSLGQAVLAPYDFDQSGLIDADYSAPAEGLPIRSVRQRLYRGYCTLNSSLDGAIARLIAARGNIDALFAAADLRGGARSRALRYLEESYAIISDPEQRNQAIDSACRE
jgi:hypothetical protein